jgi:serine/threonine protein kinase
VLLGASGEIDPPGVPSLEEIRSAFPQFEILECIGRGGMGVVYKVRQPQLDRLLALKILLPGLEHDPGFAERFSREARALAKLGHPNIVAVHDFGDTGGFFWLTMEYVDGVNLRQAMQAARFTPAQALALIPELCAALQYAHDHGILHRDIKPENILLDTRGRVKIADFGIARIAGDDHGEFTLTRTGSVLGSAAYIAPEQIERPHDVDHRADLYSLGVVFYEMLTGELPLGRFPAPSEKSASNPRLDEVVFRTLEKEREKRYQSADALRAGVEDSNSAPAAGNSVVKTNTNGLTWSVKLPVFLAGGGLLVLAALMLSLPDGLRYHFWRLLTLRNHGSVLNHEPGLKILLNLWFGMGLALLICGLGLGLWNLFRIKRGRQAIAGRKLLLGLTFWPPVLFVAGFPVVTMISDTQVLPIYQPIVFVIVFLVCAPLFHFCFPRCREDGTSRMIRKLGVGLAILLLCAAAAGSKRLHDHWASRYYPLEIGWTITSLSEAKRAELLKIVDEAAGPYRGKLMSSIDDNDLTTRFIITNGIFYKAHQNAIVLRFRSRAPEEFRPLFNNARLQTQFWRDYQVRMQRPTILIVLATVLAAVIAAWCGFPLGLIPVLAGGLFAEVLALLPAFPIPPEIEARVMSVPLDPIQPLLPDYSEPTIAIQSVLDAAFLGDERLVREGLSKRLLAVLETTGKLEDAMVRLGKRTWAMNTYDNNRVMIVEAAHDPDQPDLLAVKAVIENGQWKLDELPLLWK